MSSFMLRVIALLSMVIDHAGLALFPNIGAFRCVGRIAFPLYCFLLTQGFIHTHDRRAYARRLLLLAILSEIPFDLLIFGRICSGVEQNVLFSLLLGLLALYAVESFQSRPIYGAGAVLLLCMAAMLARVSFGWLSIMLCLCFYVYDRKKAQLAIWTPAMLLGYSLSLHLSGVAASWVLVSLCSLLCVPLILLYNGRRGLRARPLTFLFYAAYPLHIIALLVIRTMRIVPPYFFS